MEALHLTVFLLDFYMDSHLIGQDNFTLYTLCCKLLAGKVDDKLESLLLLQGFHTVVDTPFTKSDII